MHDFQLSTCHCLSRKIFINPISMSAFCRHCIFNVYTQSPSGVIYFDVFHFSITCTADVKRYRHPKVKNNNHPYRFSLIIPNPFTWEISYRLKTNPNTNKSQAINTDGLLLNEWLSAKSSHLFDTIKILFLFCTSKS